MQIADLHKSFGPVDVLRRIDLDGVTFSAGLMNRSETPPPIRLNDETTILTFRHLLEQHKLGKALFDGVNQHLACRGLLRGFVCRERADDALSRG